MPISSGHLGSSAGTHCRALLPSLNLTRRVMESICTSSLGSAQSIIATGNATAEQSQEALGECDFSDVDDCVRRGGKEAMDCVSRSDGGGIQRWPINTLDNMQLGERDSDTEEYVAPRFPAAAGSEARVATVAAMMDDIEPKRAAVIIWRGNSISSSSGDDSDNDNYLDLETNDGVSISRPPICTDDYGDAAMRIAMLNSNDECRAEVLAIDPNSSANFGSIDISPEDWLQVAEDVITS